MRLAAAIRMRGCAMAMAGVALMLVAPMARAGGDWSRLAGAMLEDQADGGMCVIVGQDDAELSLALAAQSRFIVQSLHRQEDACARVRGAVQTAGRYGAVSANLFDGAHLPYAGNLINLVVVDSWRQVRERGLSVDEMARVLAPLGTMWVHDAGKPDAELAALVEQKKLEPLTNAPAQVEESEGWRGYRKRWPAEIDQWTHYLHAADGNPVAQDRVVGPPSRYQWVAAPLRQISHETDSSISTIVTANGRLFYIENRYPNSLEGFALPDSWYLVVRDAFNGADLWKVPIRRWGWREWKSTWFNARPGDIPLNLQKRLVAAGDRVYATLGYGAPVSALDARTGRILRSFEGTEHTNEILCVEGTLVLSVLDGKQGRVMAFDAATGKKLWSSGKCYRGSTVDYVKWSEGNGGAVAELDPALNMATDGRVVSLIDGPQLVGLDFGTGAELWHRAVDEPKAEKSPGGVKSDGNLWVGAMIVRDGVVLYASATTLAAFSAADGKPLWSQPKRFIQHLWYEWKDVFLIDGLVWTWDADLALVDIATGKKKERYTEPQFLNGYDLHTGRLVKKVELGSTYKTVHHHRCYRDKATVNYILTSRRGSEFIDLRGGPHTIDNWVRGTCHVGMMPANGLQYAPPHPCVCYIDEKINGMNALAPAAGPNEPALPAATTPLVRGDAFGQVVGPDADKEDWPAYRHDAQRSGSIDAKVAAEPVALWRARPGEKVSGPIVVGDRVYAALVDEHQVICLDAVDGRTIWDFTAGGRVDSPPTYYRGAILFGSADGCVYCVRASDGRLAWRFHAAPADRFVGAFGQLESAWPVHGSVLVMEDASGGESRGATVYFAAGRSSELDGGLYLYGLDAGTGAVRHQTRLDGPHYTSKNVERNVNLPQGALPDILSSDGSLIYMLASTFDMKLSPASGKSEMRVNAGFLDDLLFKRTPWTNAGGDWGSLLIGNTRSVYCVRMFDTLKALDPNVFFTPGAKGYLLYARAKGSQNKAWEQRIPIRVEAMAATAGHLVVAGSPDVVDPKDPLGAFEGRKGGILCVFDAVTGTKTAQLPLSSPPVFNGLAAARGRVFVAESDGHISCFGRK